jgi:hypothetical protein
VDACAYVLLSYRAATQRTRLGGAQVGRWQRLQTVPTRYRVECAACSARCTGQPPQVHGWVIVSVLQ